MSPPAPSDGAPEPPKAGAYVATRLRELDAALTEVAPRLLASHRGGRAAGGDARDEAIHDLRVAIRRMRTLLKTSRGLFGRWHTDVVRGAFAEVMRATGDLRDEEVLEETLEGVAEGCAELGAWLGRRKAREAKLRKTVIARIRRGDLERARLMLEALLAFPVAPERDVVLARFARRAVERARRKVERKRDVEVTDVSRMHDLRIAYKELRYAIELFSEALPSDATALREPATVFQRRLGDLHDVDVAIDVVQGATGLSRETHEKTLAKLDALREKRVNKYLCELGPLFAPVRTEGVEDAEKAARRRAQGRRRARTRKRRTSSSASRRSTGA